MQSARVRPLERCIVALAPGRCGKVRSRRSRCGRPTSRASKRRRTKDPLYFFTASWSLGEKPTIEQARDAADTYTRKLAIEREREAAAERKAERERNADMAFAIERELRDRGVRTISHEDIFKIMPAVRAAASKIHYGSQTEIMATSCKTSLHRNSRAGCAGSWIRPEGLGHPSHRRRAGPALLVVETGIAGAGSGRFLPIGQLAKLDVCRCMLRGPAPGDGSGDP